ncbi:hypothetical protein ACROYT_G033790 [Oculina patagonica]
MKSLLLWIGVFAFLLSTCLAYRKVAPKKNPFVTDPGKPDLVAPKKHLSLTELKFVKCQSQSDCSPKECCAGVSPTTNGTCLLQPQLKEPCDPHILPGAMQCPCRVGMTCSTRRGKTNKLTGKVYGRCVYITTGPDEVDEDIIPAPEKIDEDRSMPRFS